MIGRRRGRHTEPPHTPPVPTARRGREHVLVLGTSPKAIPVARRAAELAFTAWGVAPRATVLGAAQLIVTELVTNTVRHAAERSPAIGLTLALTDDHLDIAVHDDHPRLPVAAPGGGLALIADLARDFDGALTITPDHDGPGKTIRVLLPLTPAPAP